MFTMQRLSLCIVKATSLHRKGNAFTSQSICDYDVNVLPFIVSAKAVYYRWCCRL